MHKYRVIYSYMRFYNPEANLDLTVKDNWDGEEMIEIETDKPIGSGEEGVNNDLKQISKTIGEKHGYEAVALTLIQEEVEDKTDELQTTE